MDGEHVDLVDTHQAVDDAVRPLLGPEHRPHDKNCFLTSSWDTSWRASDWRRPSSIFAMKHSRSIVSSRVACSPSMFAILPSPGPVSAADENRDPPLMTDGFVRRPARRASLIVSPNDRRSAASRAAPLRCPARSRAWLVGRNARLGRLSSLVCRGIPSPGPSPAA
jgi:hypothetical protein